MFPCALRQEMQWTLAPGLAPVLLAQAVLLLPAQPPERQGPPLLLPSLEPLQLQYRMRSWRGPPAVSQLQAQLVVDLPQQLGQRVGKPAEAAPSLPGAPEAR
mmetsp:Transcript_7038/g.16297  ORF Transcript_7038/g.16297 Transcript_7038/m.16297 type:complete len:102 (+) Transcript_7038:404-709(+)